MEANTKNPDQTALNLMEQSDLGSYCLQYSYQITSTDGRALVTSADGRADTKGVFDLIN